MLTSGKRKKGKRGIVGGPGSPRGARRSCRIRCGASPAAHGLHMCGALSPASHWSTRRTRAARNATAPSGRVSRSPPLEKHRPGRHDTT